MVKLSPTLPVGTDQSDANSVYLLMTCRDVALVKHAQSRGPY